MLKHRHWNSSKATVINLSVHKSERRGEKEKARRKWYKL
jgi:hypothetical protein